jgi:Fe-Mn family superoxide dismutase
MNKRGIPGVAKSSRFFSQQPNNSNKPLMYSLAALGAVIIFSAAVLAFIPKDTATTDPNLLLLRHPLQRAFIGEDSASVCSAVVQPADPWPSVPGQLDLLEPFISKATVNLHYFKHQGGYVTKLSAWMSSPVGTAKWPLEPAESIVTRLVRTLPHSTPEYRNAAQIFNHALYFVTIAKPTAETAASSAGFEQAVQQSFGSRAELLTRMKAAALQHFGSGWVWLLLNKTAHPSVLTITDTHDAVTPLSVGNTIVPLLVCDVWEHAYYLDRQNRRDEYFDNWAAVISWRKVGMRFDAGVVESPGNETYPNL